MKKKILMVMLVLSIVFVFSIGITEAREGGELNVAIGSNPESLDPARASSSPAAMVMIHVMENLFDMSPEGEIIPNLAKDYQMSEDGTEFEINLREGVEFHDGTKFDAEAVKFNLERMLEGTSPFTFLINKISEIEIVDEYTVVIHTEEPFAPLIPNLSAHGFMAMASPEAVKEHGEDFTNNPVGTGPFEFVRWEQGEMIILERNENYWGDDVYLDRVTFSIVPEDSTRVILVETGEADVAMFVPPRERDRLAGADGVNVVELSSLRTIYAGFNVTKEPLDDIRVRQAINYAIDNQAIVEQVMQGAGRPSDSPVAPGTLGYAAQEEYDYQPEKAKELLAEAGYPDGFEITFHHPVGRYMMDETIAQAIQSQLAEVGIEAKLETLEWATYLEFTGASKEESEHEMYLLGWGNMTGDSDNGIYPLFHSSQNVPNGSDRSYYENEEVDRLLDEARMAADVTERENLYADAIEIIWEEAPWLFLHSEMQINAVREGVEGLLHHPREYVSVKEAYITD
ncbi:MAG: glutathione ABC transporter substrate-binding protein [Bacillota bacterium]